MILSLFFAILALLSSVSLAAFKCANGGNFNENPNNNNACEFQCYDTNTYYTQDAITFDEVEDDCYQVRYASLFGFCSSKQDLVWPDNYCGCPKCKCSTEGESEIHSLQRLVNRRCYNMTCTDDSSYTSPIWELDEIGDVYDAYNWNDFACPPVGYCEDPIPTSSPTKYPPGDGWFPNKDPLNPGSCDEFCYCSLNAAKTGAEKACASITDVVNMDSTSAIKASFHDQCEWELRACLSTSSPKTSMIADSGPYCGQWDCPSCSCGNYAEGASWFVEYVSVEDYYVGAKQCATCTCEKNYNDELVAECHDDFAYKEGSCPGAAQLNCHIDYGDNYNSNSVGEIFTGQLNSELCTTNAPEQWCGIELEIDNSGNNDWFDWGCDNILCGVYGQDDNCFYTEYSMNYKDCYDNTRTETDTQYHYCCKTANCNHQNITMSKQTCSKNEDFSELLSELFSCVFEEQRDCEDRIDIEEELTCESVKDLFQVEADCYCKAYRSLYNAAKSRDKSTEWQQWIEDQINMFMSRFSEWNGVIECPVDIYITCDLEGGEIILVDENGDPFTPSSNAYQNKQYFVLALFTLVIAIVNY